MFHVYLTAIIFCAMCICGCFTTDIEDLAGVGGWWDFIHPVMASEADLMILTRRMIMKARNNVK